MTQDEIKALKDTIANNEAQITQLTLLNQAMQKALDLAQTGYQSDQDAIQKGIASGIAAAKSALEALTPNENGN